MPLGMCQVCNRRTHSSFYEAPNICYHCKEKFTKRDFCVYGNSAVGSEPVPASVVIDAAVVERACEAFYADESFKWGDFSSPGKKIAMERMTAALKAIR